jgi:hypothetical protein
MNPPVSLDLIYHRLADAYRAIDTSLDVGDQRAFRRSCRELRNWLAALHSCLDNASVADIAPSARPSMA